MDDAINLDELETATKSRVESSDPDMVDLDALDADTEVGASIRAKVQADEEKMVEKQYPIAAPIAKFASKVLESSAPGIKKTLELQKSGQIGENEAALGVGLRTLAAPVRYAFGKAIEAPAIALMGLSPESRDKSYSDLEKEFQEGIKPVTSAISAPIGAATEYAETNYPVAASRFGTALAALDIGTAVAPKPTAALLEGAAKYSGAKYVAGKVAEKTGLSTLAGKVAEAYTPVDTTGLPMAGSAEEAMAALKPDVGQVIDNPVPTALRDEAAKALNTAVKPYNRQGMTQAMRASNENRSMAGAEVALEHSPNMDWEVLGKEAPKSGVPNTAADALDLVSSARKDVYNKYNLEGVDVPAKVNNKPVASQIADDLEGLAYQKDKVSLEQAQALRKEAENLRALGEQTLAQAEETVKAYNADLKRSYQMGASQFDAKRVAADLYRASLNDAVEGLVGKGYAEFKRDYGALAHLEAGLNRAVGRANNLSRAGLIDQAAHLFGSAEAVHAAGQLLTGNVPGAIMAGGKIAATQAVKAYIKRLNSVDYNISRFFKAVDKARTKGYSFRPYASGPKPTGTVAESIGKIDRAKLAEEAKQENLYRTHPAYQESPLHPDFVSNQLKKAEKLKQEAEAYKKQYPVEATKISKEVETPSKTQKKAKSNVTKK